MHGSGWYVVCVSVLKGMCMQCASRMYSMCAYLCQHVSLFVILSVCKCKCVFFPWSWELTGSVRRGSLIQCFEMSPPAVVGLRDRCLGGGLGIRCSFYLHSSGTFSFFLFFSFCLSSFSSIFLSFFLPESNTFNIDVARRINT